RDWSSVVCSSDLISRNPIPGKAGIQDYLLGNASTLTRADVKSALVIGGGVLLILSLVHLKQSAVVFDAPFAQLAGIKLNIVRSLGFIALVAITVIGVKVVGVVLMVAVVIAPAVAARQWTNRLIPFIACSGAIGGLSAVLGTYFSIAAGETAVGSIPTGPAIVLVQGLIAAASLTARRCAPLMSLALSACILAITTALACAIPGVFVVLKRDSMLIDGIGHAVLPGIAVGYLFTSDIDSPWLLLTAALGGLAVALGTDWLGRSGIITND